MCYSSNGKLTKPVSPQYTFESFHYFLKIFNHIYPRYLVSFSVYLPFLGGYFMSGLMRYILSVCLLLVRRKNVLLLLLRAHISEWGGNDVIVCEWRLETTLWSWFSPSTFTWVLRLKLRPPRLARQVLVYWTIPLDQVSMLLRHLNESVVHCIKISYWTYLFIIESTFVWFEIQDSDE